MIANYETLRSATEAEQSAAKIEAQAEQAVTA